jgi:hypothetical protein
MKAFQTKKNKLMVENERIGTQLTSDNWKWYQLTTLFTVEGRARSTSLVEVQEMLNENRIQLGRHPHCSAQATNNAVTGFYTYWTEHGNVLTFESAVMGFCTYQALDFSATNHVEKLIPKFEFNAYRALFFVSLLRLEEYRYNYGRGCTQTRI